PEDPQSLEDLLDAAGRAAQPTDLGWQTLPARLAALPQQQPWTLGRWATLPLGVAAAATLFLVIWLGPGTVPPVEAGPIVVQRQGVELTIFSAAETDGETLYMPLAPPRRRGPTLTGQALVKDRRLILNLKAGDNVVRFTDVAATIDPTSVRFESRTDPLGTHVVEQSFEYDLATADALLKRYLDRRVTCVGKDGEERSGYLVSFDGQTIVLAAAPGQKQERGTESLSRAALKAVRLEDMPSDLVVRPTLVWKLRTRTPGKHETLLTYICGFVKWQADYVVLVTPGKDGQPELLDVSAWVTIDNTSGSAYPDAGLRLIAGDIHRLRDPWAVELELRLGERDLDGTDLFLADRPELARGPDKLREFVQKAFFEYHLYSLSTPSTIRDRQIKQLNLFQRKGVKTTRRYVYEPWQGRRLGVELLAKNDKDNNLGVPLPKGRVAVEQRDRDGETAVIGRTEIDHTAVKEEIALKYAYAFDVVGEHRQVSRKAFFGDRLLGIRWEAVYEMRVRNHKAEPIQVRAFAQRLNPHDRLIEASLALHHKDTQTIYFDFNLAANAERTIRYTIETQE
ncbi:MAG TPA: hypothetical protein VEL76_15340, partial [Gemmataceae bacterium]|nr:hypothetical protein [Gemmataceae bacterium]